MDEGLSSRSEICSPSSARNLVCLSTTQRNSSVNVCTHFPHVDASHSLVGLGHAPVYSLKQTEVTIEGLRKIRIKEVHAIAVVHEDTGKLVGCLSESDLREISSDTYAAD